MSHGRNLPIESGFILVSSGHRTNEMGGGFDVSRRVGLSRKRQLETNSKRRGKKNKKNCCYISPTTTLQKVIQPLGGRCMNRSGKNKIFSIHFCVYETP